MVFLEKLGKYKIIRIEDSRKMASYKITTEKLMSFLLPSNLLENMMYTTKQNKTKDAVLVIHCCITDYPKA